MLDISLILASASPRRRELLAQIGVTCTSMPLDLDEGVYADEAPASYVERLAREKAQEGYRRQGSAAARVLGADTSVVCDGEILGKPQDLAAACAMLRRLSGRTHQVMTAVALAGPAGCDSRLVCTDVVFRPLHEAEIQAYVATGESMDKAGAYGIQGRAAIFVEQVRGSYSSVVGLPLQETADLLANAGLPVWQLWERAR